MKVPEGTSEIRLCPKFLKKQDATYKYLWIRLKHCYDKACFMVCKPWIFLAGMHLKYIYLFQVNALSYLNWPIVAADCVTMLRLVLWRN